MIPVALVLLIITIIFAVRERAWFFTALVLITGIFLAGTPWGMRAVQFINMCIGWVTGIFNG